MPVQAEAETNGFRFDCYLLFAIAINKICCFSQWLVVSFARVPINNITNIGQHILKAARKHLQTHSWPKMLKNGWALVELNKIQRRKDNIGKS